MIDRVHARHADVLFLSEAFTRPAVMRYLAKAGFTQSYTYFTWRNTKAELTEYFTELTTGEAREYLRPNLFANTPDILHAYLQHGGRPAFEARLLLAATLGASYGIYSGFELCEGQAIPGTEEYADSEKYQFRKWDWDRPGNIAELVAPRQRDPPRASRAAVRHARCGFTPPTTPRSSPTASARPTARSGCSIDRQPRSAAHAARARRRARRSGPTTPTRVRDLLDDVDATTGAARGTTCASIRTSARDTSCGYRHPEPDDAGRRAVADAVARRRRRSALVQGRGHLPGARQVVLRQQQRRHRRLPGADAEARLPAGARRHLPLAAAVLPVAAQGRRLRHRRLPERPSRATARSTTSRRSCDAAHDRGTSRC